ncbi:ATP-binding protein [Pseudooceanicola sp. HF7]|uniref:AAA family ATPase n=1 Tax=Pseudooceanicola sp. HF7 TaxID=2721560 RepID=UPI0014300369|nr:ATP-binding protein [Pseudooceanicola sp. HF7]NIZ10084.1 AAA family ATPase [Pseudooceanicola sp. HF7]
MSLSGDLMELREEDIRKHYPAALALLEGFDHAPRIAAARVAEAPERSPGLGTRRRFRSTTPGLVTRRSEPAAGVHLLDRIGECDDGDALQSPRQAALAQALRRAIAIGLAVGEAFSEASGLSELKRANLEAALPAERRAGFAELLAAESLAVLHVTANAAAWLLAAHQGETPVEIGPVEEVLTDNAPLALQGTLWELDGILADVAHGDEARLVPAVVAWAETLMEAVARRSGAPGLAAFTGARWRVAADELVIQGFSPATHRRSGALTMSFKRPEEVVGNHIAKQQALRLSKMLMAYDFTRQMNPFAELGGFVFTFMGDGAPGTGKTTLIQMMTGMIHGYCEIAGYPFRYRNLSTESIDSYQGKSGQNAKSFVSEVLDPAVIGFGTIDDIDQIAGRRGDRQSSAGQQEITAVLMESFAGAQTVVRGNCTFGMFSNFPENVDDALRQRAGARFLVDGPQSREDYIDILTLLLGKGHDIPLGKHDLYAAQELQQAVARSYAGHSRPAEAALSTVFTEVEARVGPLNTLEKLGTYLRAIAEADPRFTGRAVKNVTDAVKVRAMDFDLPDDWLEEPERFLFRDYETKLGMISELRKPVTAEMVLQEINRYADAEFRYAGKSDAAAVDDMVREMGLRERAQKRFLERGA